MMISNHLCPISVPFVRNNDKQQSNDKTLYFFDDETQKKVSGIFWVPGGVGTLYTNDFIEIERIAVSQVQSVSPHLIV